MADNEELRNNLVSFKEAFRDYTDSKLFFGRSLSNACTDDRDAAF